MLACICCGTFEIAACVVATTVLPAVYAVVADYRKRPLDTKTEDCNDYENQSETTDVPA